MRPALCDFIKLFFIRRAAWRGVAENNANNEDMKNGFIIFCFPDNINPIGASCRHINNLVEAHSIGTRIALNKLYQNSDPIDSVTSF
jgi:hypothetical protein